jgi:hypothetical protein
VSRRSDGRLPRADEEEDDTEDKEEDDTEDKEEEVDVEVAMAAAAVEEECELSMLLCTRGVEGAVERRRATSNSNWL